MILAVIGGKLQGCEALYLARKAGYYTLLLDRAGDPPGKGLCHTFIHYDFDTYPETAPPLPQGIRPDLILPALEDPAVLERAGAWAKSLDIPMAFDLDAFHLTTSKHRSNALFEKLDLPRPRPWPECGFPVVVKPDSASGSQGVFVVRSQAELDALAPEEDAVIQEFVEGPSYSIEVAGLPGDHRALQVTELSMDAEHDCCRVTAPVSLSPEEVHAFEKMALTLAGELDLKGIMDLEVIRHQGDLKLLEIDARLPSQTPMAVLGATGMNMVALLAQHFVPGAPPVPCPRTRPAWCRVEHIQVDPLEIEVMGEHIMATDGPLELKTDFFGATEAVTSHAPGKTQWVATLIFIAPDPQTLEENRRACYDRIRALNRK